MTFEQLNESVFTLRNGGAKFFNSTRPHTSSYIFDEIVTNKIIKGKKMPTRT